MKEDLQQLQDLESLAYYVNRHSNKYTKDELVELIVSLINVLPHNIINTNIYADDKNDAHYIMEELKEFYGDNFKDEEESEGISNEI